MSSKWKEHYRTNKHVVWIKCETADGEEHFMYKMSDWTNLIKACKDKGVKLRSLSIQYRSHEEKLDVTNCDNVYLITSIMGSMGVKSRNYLTYGKINGDKVKKQMWIIPELVVEKTYDDIIDNCFEEAIIDVEKTEKVRQE
tara:strand:+ start:89 stop:511 length:423 start_codon:yes stop_codon:yes gene_type:complete